jgi:hypothetical protein
LEAPASLARAHRPLCLMPQTRVLEKSIGKICSLLAIGFGDAGAEIIGANMKNGGDLNPMVPGRKVNAIFGFCDIRQFTDTTEVLQEQVRVISRVYTRHLKAVWEQNEDVKVSDSYRIAYWPQKLTQVLTMSLHTCTSGDGVRQLHRSDRTYGGFVTWGKRK